MKFIKKSETIEAVRVGNALYMMERDFWKLPKFLIERYDAGELIGKSDSLDIRLGGVWINLRPDQWIILEGATPRILSSEEFHEKFHALPEDLPKICWCIEKGPGVNYYTCPDGYFEDLNEAIWTSEWDQALKFFDRDSCERICAEMPHEWDVKILEHQIG